MPNCYPHGTPWQQQGDRGPKEKQNTPKHVETRFKTLQLQHFRTLLSEGMAYGHAKLETSCLLLHVLVACTLVELRQAFRRRKPQRWACRVARVLSVGWFDLIRNLDTSPVVFLRGTCSGLGPSEGGIVYGLSRPTEHIRCLKKKTRYRLLRRCSFLSIGCLPTISQTLAAEALAISMEAMRRMQQRNVGCAAKRTMPRSGLVVGGR